MKKAEVSHAVEIFCDGACSGNPGPGGWGAIIRFTDTEKEISGGSLFTTNNRMELTACTEALSCLEESCSVVIQTDSQYVSKAFTDGWLEKWRKNGWQTSERKPVKNQDLWKKLYSLSQMHSLRWNWIKGHAGHPENERCDALAVAACGRTGKT